jgi:hypothetical protein
MRHWPLPNLAGEHRHKEGNSKVNHPGSERPGTGLVHQSEDCLIHTFEVDGLQGGRIVAA